MDAKILNKISKLIDKTEYKTAYIEIQTAIDKYTLDKEKSNVVGFKIDKEEEKKRK